ncbi:MAG TPA: helix-turn-helix transcriptional regulator [Thermoanaerobaculia bacterium]|jgi:transcriptional regulator with XRE-family HTH domain|nr:helix-turn-helix transcriptional regulator [Thermoanaerobaculia bacterium]
MAVVTPAGKAFGERMREVRQKRGLTQAEVSERSRLPQARISELERGARMPNLVTILRLAVALDCKVTDLTSVFDKVDLPSLLPK